MIRNIPVTHATIRQLKEDPSLNINSQGKKYPCDSCEYQATTKGSLTTHKNKIHEVKKYPCYLQGTTRGNLSTHKQWRNIPVTHVAIRQLKEDT